MIKQRILLIATCLLCTLAIGCTGSVAKGKYKDYDTPKTQSP